MIFMMKRMAMKRKISFILCSMLTILCLGACGNRQPQEEHTAPVAEASSHEDIHEVDAGSQVAVHSIQEEYRGHIINVRDYIAYITEDKQVYCITEQGGNYVPDIVDAKRLYADSEYLIILLENGTFRLYHTQEAEFFTLEDARLDMEAIYDSGYLAGMDIVENQLLLLEAERVTDAYICSFSFVALKKEGSDTWEFGSNSIADEDYEEAKRVVSFATNLSCTWPGYALREDGTVHTLSGCFPGGYEEKQIAKWTDVQDLVCGVTLFARWRDGTVDAPRRSYGEASEMKDWQNIVQISADPFVTAALTADGCVLVDCFQKEDTLKVAEEWTDIIYLSVFTEYILGVKADGSFCVTPTGSWYDTVFEEPEHPKSMVKTGE